jgi:hypothetical protein
VCIPPTALSLAVGVQIGVSLYVTSEPIYLYF